jgi:hypothetical protein
MPMTAAELLDAAKALTPEERVEVAEGIIATLGDGGVFDEPRLAVMRAAVDAAEASVASGRVVRISEGGIDDYVRGRGERAARIADAQIA